MKKYFLRSALNFFLILFFINPSHSQESKPDTVKTGIYITSIHNIDFKDQEYTITFWLWLKYKNKDFDFANNLEVPMAKTVTRSFLTVDSSDGRIFMTMKMQCVMKDSWRIRNFPFDLQRLRMSIENSQFDSRSLVFVADTVGKNYDPRFTLMGWKIDSCVIMTGKKAYETAFGDETIFPPHTEYSNFRVRMVIKRGAGGLFWKMFLGMYIAFLIAFVSFYIHVDGMDSRFGLSVGALFAVIGNKYIIDSSLPETSSFTLVDLLHGITLFFIFCIIAANTYSMKLVKQNKMEKAHRFDMKLAKAIMLAYVALNVWLIIRASNAG